MRKKKKDFGATVVTFITALEHWLHSLHVARFDSKKGIGKEGNQKHPSSLPCNSATGVIIGRNSAVNKTSDTIRIQFAPYAYTRETPLRLVMCHRSSSGSSCPSQKGVSWWQSDNFLCVAGGSTAKHALHTVNGLGSVAGSHGAHQQEEDESSSTDDDGFALSGVVDTVLSPDAASLTSVLADLVGTKLVVDETDQRNRVTKELSASDRSLPNHHGSNDQQDILEDTAEGHDQRRSLANQEDNRDVEHEGNNGVGKEGPDTNVVDMTYGQVGNLEEQSRETVHDSANGGKVVQRNQRVHLVLGGAEQTLDHDQASGLEDDTTNLEDESNEDEFDLTKRGNDDTNNNGGHVHENLQVNRSHTHTPGREEHSNGSGGLSLLARI